MLLKITKVPERQGQHVGIPGLFWSVKISTWESLDCNRACQLCGAGRPARHTFWEGSGLACAAGLKETATLSSSGSGSAGGAGLGGALSAGTPPPSSEGSIPVASKCSLHPVPNADQTHKGHCKSFIQHTQAVLDLPLGANR